MHLKEQQLARIRQDKGIHADLFYMCLPLLAMAFAFYGLRSVLLCGTAVIAANLSDRLVAWLRGRPYEKGEWSSEAFAFMLALTMPATVSYYVVIVGAVAAVLLGKEAFGGYGCYVFHPTAVGYAVVAVSWPEQVFRYPEAQLFQSLPLGSVSSVQLVDSPLHALKTGGLPTLDNITLFLGNYAGPMGVTALLVIMACALFLANRRSLHLSVMFSFLGMCALVAFVAPRLGEIPAFSMPWTYVADRLAVMKYELCSGGLLFAAVFLMADPVICPTNRISRILYGALTGFMAMMFRYYGNYETGVCFAILAMNAFSGWLDRAVLRILHRKGVVRREL